ncbi:carbohydrate ABC transporter permease [Aureibacillus halotolerans]|uniref:Carbohydrate ABC transporter membrane protein 1 (CUT1 family) n=1 Tax=Aureibacillus halotolerans TaxID=1508390 RepID=A0A4R6U4P5_9BACI|nr:sugar ABC transporter permease [Aureibacillus halotolerans]TDQ39763.1 carbohydrate ABC transporter membrane protein 1 (CUT1 family) [Aureibacillus halotolerans]
MNEQPTWASTAKAFVYLLPAFAIIAVFTMYPILSSLVMSFYTDYDFFNNEVYAYGFGNFVELATDPSFRTALLNTLIFVIGVVPASILISLVIAVLLNSNIKGIRFFRTSYFLPFVTSVVAVSIVWNWIYHSDYGLLNYGLGLFGIAPIDWLTDPAYAMPALIILCIWKGLGFNIVIFLAGLQGIDRNHILAAKIDGARGTRRFFHIIVPLLSSTTFFVTLITMISSFKVFDEVYALFSGRPGPANSALTVVYYVYQKFYSEWEFGLASAAAYVLFVIILLLTIVQIVVSKKLVHYQ